MFLTCLSFISRRLAWFACPWWIPFNPLTGTVYWPPIRREATNTIYRPSKHVLSLPCPDQEILVRRIVSPLADSLPGETMWHITVKYPASATVYSNFHDHGMDLTVSPREPQRSIAVLAVQLASDQAVIKSRLVLGSTIRLFHQAINRCIYPTVRHAEQTCWLLLILSPVFLTIYHFLFLLALVPLFSRFPGHTHSSSPFTSSSFHHSL